MASKVEVPKFVPNDEKAKEIQASVNKEAKQSEQEEEKSSLEEDISTQQVTTEANEQEKLLQRFQALLKELGKGTAV